MSNPNENAKSNKHTLIKETYRQIKTEIDEIQEELLIEAGALDFYLGYGLDASINDRLDEIGDIDAASQQFTENVGAERLQRTKNGQPTEVARLLSLKERALAALQAAKELPRDTEDGQETTDFVETTDTNTLRSK